MTRALLASMALLAVVGTASADEPQQVRHSATVEVLDDKSQIDDVISRLKSEPARDAPKTDPRTNRLPPPPSVERDPKRAPKPPTPHPLRRERHERTLHKH